MYRMRPCCAGMTFEWNMLERRTKEGAPVYPAPDRVLAMVRLEAAAPAGKAPSPGYIIINHVAIWCECPS